MEIKLPEWATNKEQEGMKAFLEIVNEYGQFEVEFKPTTFADDVGFEAVVSWSPFARPDIIHKVPYSIHYNFEQLFNHENAKINTWQFVFDDNGIEISGQVFYMELFQYLDKQISSLTKAA